MPKSLLTGPSNADESNDVSRETEASDRSDGVEEPVDSPEPKKATKSTKARSEK